MKSTYSTQHGFSLVEAVIIAAVASFFIIALSTLNSTYLTRAFAQGEKIRAYLLLEGGVEAVRFMRDTSFSGLFGTLSTTTSYYLLWTNSSWQATTTPQSNDNFYQSFTVQDVYRDTNSAIASSGTFDPDTKLITVSVTWKNGAATSTESIQTYFTNILSN